MIPFETLTKMNPLRWLLSLFSPHTTNNNSPESIQSKSSLYGLDHAILNIPIPPPSMWMNLGYWKETTDFPTACATLLDQVLITAGFLDKQGHPIRHDPRKRFRLLDVGIGCGDQSVRLLDLTREKPSNSSSNEERGEEEPLFDSYVGITSLPLQAEFALRRVEQYQTTLSFPRTSTSGGERKKDRVRRGQIFCADAAMPTSWGAEIHSSLSQHPTPSPSKSPSNPSVDIIEENWLLALDTLYHFYPSRVPLLTYANSTLQASFMTFDLVLPSTPLSLTSRTLLRLVCLLTKTPYSNFLTQDQYTALLVRAGYDPEKILFRDISEDVFCGIARYLREREGVLGAYGLGKKVMRKFWGARVVFEWWGRQKVVRGVVVVARA